MPVEPPRKTKRIQYFMDFLCLHLRGIHYTKNLKDKDQPHSYTQVSMQKLSCYIYWLRRVGMMKKKIILKTQKNTTPAFTPAWYLPKQRWIRRTLLKE